MVESGGEWINPETGEIEPKVHLHWRLKKPAAGGRGAGAAVRGALAGDPAGRRRPHQHLDRASDSLAWLLAPQEDAEAGADHGARTTRPRSISTRRWSGCARRPKPPGSSSLPAAAGAASTARPHEAADQSLVASALAVIPNGTDPKAHDWEYWNKIGMTIWASTDGSEEGRAAFHEWSSKSPKYDQATTEARWKHYFRSPPNRLGFGSLVYRAREADPEWRYQHPMNAPAKKAVGEFIAQLLRERDEADDDNAGRTTAARPGGAAPPLIEAKAFVLRDPKTLPQRQWLYGYHLIRKFGSATFAASGSGKTNLLIAEALAMATGRPLLGIVPPRASRVWLWNGEDPMDELERRDRSRLSALRHHARGDRRLAVRQQRSRSGLQGRHRHPGPQRDDDRRSRGRRADRRPSAPTRSTSS